MKNKIHERLSIKKLGIRVGLLCCDIDQTHHVEGLKFALESRMADLSKQLKTEEIPALGGIKWGRMAYRKLGKDPTRYRLSSEKLLRRIAKGDQVPRVNPLVDLMNWVSIETQSPIGVFDYGLLKPPFLLDYGDPLEFYHCLAGYELNLEGLLVIRDALGPFGSTTSDATRAPVSMQTKKALVVIYALDPEQDLEEDLKMALSMLKTYLNGACLWSQMLE